MEEGTVTSRIASQLLDEARNELVRADEKASSALGAMSALVAIVAVVPNGANPGRDISTWTWTWAAGLLTCAIATVLLMLAALPRLNRGPQRQLLTYFGDAARVRHERDLGYLLGRLAQRPEDAVLAELRAVSKIVVMKYRYTRFGIIFATLGAALIVISGI